MKTCKRLMALYGMALLFLISACSKKDADTDPGTNGNGTDSVPQIIAFSPAAGATDTLVTITGKNFTNDKSIIAVRFGTTAATDIVSASTTEIKVKVPKAALPGKVKLTVTVAGKDAASANDFTIEPPTWNKLFGGDNEELGINIWRTSDGGYITVARTLSNNSGDVGVSKGNSDIWVVKTDADGNKVWQKTYGGSGGDYPTAITGTADGGVVIAGYTNSSNSGDVGLNHGYDDAWIFKLDANGNLLWQKTFGDAISNFAQDIISSGDGGFIVAGLTYVSTHRDVWIFKLDANGNLLWQKTFGGSDEEYTSAITASGDGGFVVTATTASNNTGDVGSNHGNFDMWVVKFDANGNLVWQKTLGGSEDEYTNDIIRSADGGFVVIGRTR
ncbi:MAG TPA: IPT/TIG domain-containing protein, partial [Niastella sp.]